MDNKKTGRGLAVLAILLALIAGVSSVIPHLFHIYVDVEEDGTMNREIILMALIAAVIALCTNKHPQRHPHLFGLGGSLAILAAIGEAGLFIIFHNYIILFTPARIPGVPFSVRIPNAHLQQIMCVASCVLTIRSMAKAGSSKPTQPPAEPAPDHTAHDIAAVQRHIRSVDLRREALGEALYRENMRIDLAELRRLGALSEAEYAEKVAALTPHEDEESS